MLKQSFARTHIPVGFELTYHSQQERMKSKRAHLVAGKEQQYKTTLFKFSTMSIVLEEKNIRSCLQVSNIEC